MKPEPAVLTRTFIEKTLLDIGGLAVDEDSSVAGAWQLYAYKMPRLTASLFTEKSSADSYKSVNLEFHNSTIQQRLESTFKQICVSDGDGLYITSDTELEAVCAYVGKLIDQLPADFDADETQEFDPALDKEDTETEALKKERRGQDKYRKRLEQLWDSRCAVTGVGIPEVLRASHAKPWKDCKTGQERLDPFNGFLLTANLDALFDKFLISFDDDGHILISPSLSMSDLGKMGITADLRLRRIDLRHLPYLAYHRSIFTRMEQNCISGCITNQ